MKATDETTSNPTAAVVTTYAAYIGIVGRLSCSECRDRNLLAKALIETLEFHYGRSKA